MNRSALRTLIRSWINEPTEGFWLNSELNTYINIANQKINAIITAIRDDFFTISKTFSTTTNTKSYTWPSDFGGLRRMEHYSTSDPSDIQKIDLLKFPRSEAGGEWPFSQSGKSTRYVSFGDHFDLLPIPDAAYTLRMYYDAVKADLTLDTDSPSSPVQFHDMTAIWATILALPKNHEDASNFERLWSNRENDLITYMAGLGKGEDSETVEGYMEGVW